MGRAVVTENRGEALYKIRLEYDETALTKELDDIAITDAEYSAVLLAALDTRRTRKAARDDARVGLDAVVLQWKEALIDAAQEDPPPIDPVAPGGLPEDEQPSLLLDAINDARGTALIRKTTLDLAARTLLERLAASGRTTASTTAERMVGEFGYTFDSEIGAAIVLAFGQSTAERAADAMLRNPVYREAIGTAGFIDVGAAYLYRSGNTYTHLWGAIMSAPGPEAPSVKLENPAEDAANASDALLEKVELPTVDNFQPSKLGEAARLYAMAAAAYNVADKEVARLQAEKLERDKRKAELESVRAASSVPIDAWCCLYYDDIAVGDAVMTAEVPGDYRPEPTDRETLMGEFDNVPVAYQERSINILPTIAQAGQLRSAHTLHDGAVFLNAALEPGWCRWQPLWRYGIITAIESNSICTVELSAITARKLSGETPFEIDVEPTLYNVPINFSTCVAPYGVGDEVLISFTDQDRANPLIIGWRREPRACVSGRLSWREVKG